MHFNGQVWRPPFEANSALLQVTSGCMHNKCKFCSLYNGTAFRMSPISEVEEDLDELKRIYPQAKRVFLTGANPLGLNQDRLIAIAVKIREYLPHVTSIGGFARIADIKQKAQEEINQLHSLGYDAISFGTETGDDATLAYMNKGNSASDIVEQLQRLDNVGIRYHIVFMNGLAGAGNGQRHALESARIYNQTKPVSINIVALTIFPEAALYKEMLEGAYKPSGELEKLIELKTFIESLNITTRINANTVSNTTPFIADIPKDKESLLKGLQKTIKGIDEVQLAAYRNSIRSL